MVLSLSYSRLNNGFDFKNALIIKIEFFKSKPKTAKYYKEITTNWQLLLLKWNEENEQFKDFKPIDIFDYVPEWLKEGGYKNE
jgi:hypothetical protein